MRFSREFIGETLGAFLLVLFGCGSVAVSVLFGAYQGIMQIALAPLFIGLTIKSTSTQCNCTTDKHFKEK